MEIRKADVSDAKTVSEIIKLSFEKQAHILKMTEQQYPHYVAFENPEAVIGAIEKGETIYLLMELDTNSAGTIRFNVDADDISKGYINRLAVLPKHRKNGYGKALMSFAEDKLKESGVSIVEISIVKQFNKLQSFYESIGYKATRDKKYPFFPFEVRYLEKIV